MRYLNGKVAEVRTSQGTYPYTSTACYEHRFTTLYVDEVRTSQGTLLYTYTVCYGDRFTSLYGQKIFTRCILLAGIFRRILSFEVAKWQHSRIPPSGMLLRVTVVRNDVWGECVAFIIRFTTIGMLGTTLAILR
jgi:hypothetical protein